MSTDDSVGRQGADKRRWQEFDEAGYGEALIPIKPGEKGCFLGDWQAKPSEDLRREHEERHGQPSEQADIGLRTRDFPTIDVDVDDTSVVNIVVAAINRALPGLDCTPSFERDRCDERGEQTSPRRALILRRDPNAQPWTKKTRIFQGPSGTESKIEILADGQQVRVDGTHPSRDFYRSPGELPKADELLAVTETDMDRVLDEITRALTARNVGMTLVSIGRGRSGGGGAQAQALPEEAGPLVRELVLMHMPNKERDFPDYDDAVRVCAAIWGASGGASWGYDLWRDWALSYDGAPNEDHWIDARWNSMAGGTQLGLGHLVNKAREIAAERSSDETAMRKAMNQIARLGIVAKEVRPGETRPFSEIGIADPSTSPDSAKRYLAQQTGNVQAANQKAHVSAPGAAVPEPVPSTTDYRACPFGVLLSAGDRSGRSCIEDCTQLSDLARTLVYVRSEGAYFCRATHALVGASETALRSGLPPSIKADADAWARANHSGKGRPPGGKILEWIQATGAAVLVSTRAYWPGAPEFYLGAKGEMTWNTWAPPKGLLHAIRNPAANADPHLGDLGVLVRGIVNNGDKRPSRDSELLLDWLTWTVCAPGLKPGWHPMLCGGQGLGKSSIAETLKHLVGLDNYTQIGSHAFRDSYNDWAETRFALVEEAKGLGGAGRSNAAQADAYNNIKTLLAPVPEIIRINPKYGKHRDAANRACVLILTNYATQALALDPDDRRLFVLESTLTRQCPEYLANLVPALESLAATRETDNGRMALWQGMVARMTQIHQDKARFARMLGDAPMTDAKRTVIRSTQGPLPTLVSELIEDGTLSGAYTIGELRQKIQDVSAVRRVPRSVQEAAASNNGLVNVLRELGWPRYPNDNKIPCPDGKRRRLWMAPTKEAMENTDQRNSFARAWQQAPKEAWAGAWEKRGETGSSTPPSMNS